MIWVTENVTATQLQLTTTGLKVKRAVVKELQRVQAPCETQIETATRACMHHCMCHDLQHNL